MKLIRKWCEGFRRSWVTLISRSMQCELGPQVRDLTYKNESWSKQLLAAGAALVLALSVIGCGSSNVVPGMPSSTQVRIGDAPIDKILAFEITINSIKLASTSGSTVALLSSPTEVELTHLAGTFEPLVLDSIPQGTYAQATITVSSPEITYIDPTTGQIVEKQAALSSSTAVVNLNNLAIGSNVSVNFDFNLASSVSFDASNNATVTPVFLVSSAAIPPNNEDVENGEVEDAEGVVVSVTGSSITIAPEEAAQNLTFIANSNTVLDGVSGLANILPGELVQIDAVTQPDGTLLATKIEIQDAQTNGLDTEGLVTSVTANPATSFTVVVQDEATSSGVKPVLGNPVTVTVSSNTAYKFNADHVDISNLSFTPTFNAGTIAKGQRVEVDADSPNSSNILAQKVELQQQAISGTVSNYTGSGSQASFTLTVAADSAVAKLAGLTSVIVYQQPKTELKNIAAVTNGASVRARGLLLFDGANYRFVASSLGAP